MKVRNLEPEIVWNHFEDLNSIPRPSKKEEQVIAFILPFNVIQYHLSYFFVDVYHSS